MKSNFSAQIVQELLIIPKKSAQNVTRNELEKLAWTIWTKAALLLYFSIFDGFLRHSSKINKMKITLLTRVHKIVGKFFYLKCYIQGVVFIKINNFFTPKTPWIGRQDRFCDSFLCRKYKFVYILSVNRDKFNCLVIFLHSIPSHLV